MKPIQTLLTISTCFVLLFACKKEHKEEEQVTTPPPVVETKATLTLDPVKKKYIDPSGKPYYSGGFDTLSFPFWRAYFKINLEKGKEYRFIANWITHKDIVDLIDLTVFDQNLKVLAQSKHNNGLVYYKSNYEGTAYIGLYRQPYFDPNEDNRYRLYMEEIYNYKMNWLGKQWVANGDWSINTDGNLQFAADGSFIKRWIKLDDSQLLDYTASMMVRTINGSGSSHNGFLVNGGDTVNIDIMKYLDRAYNLPISGYLYLANSFGEWESGDSYYNSSWKGGSSANAAFPKDSWVPFTTAPHKSAERTFSINNRIALDDNNTDTITTACKKGFLFFVMENDSMDKILELKDFTIQ